MPKLTSRERIGALMKIAKVKVDRIIENNEINEFEIRRDGFYASDNEPEIWRALTDSEATKKAKEYIRKSLWTMPADFISQYIEGTNKTSEEALQKMQHELGEPANGLIMAAIGGEKQFDEFAADAIKTYGRGHFLTPYGDRGLHQIKINKTEYFVYRLR